VSKTRILIVDDNEHDRMLTERELRRQISNSTVVSVGTDQEFIRALSGDSFQLAITDFHLPWSDGLKIFQRIREADPACPVILYTGSGSKETAARALEAGIDDYVVKSVDHLPELMMSARLALERRRQQQAAAQAEDRFQFLFRTLPVGLLLTGPSGEPIDINPRLLEMLGYPDRESFLSPDRVHFFENDEAAAEFHRRIRANQTVEGYETRLRRRDGSVFWSRFFVHPVQDPAGQNFFFEAVVEDIQARKDAEQARLEKEGEASRIGENLRAILEAVPAPIFGIDSRGLIGWVWNQAAETLLGIPRDQAFGRNIHDVIPDLARHDEALFPAAGLPAPIRDLELALPASGRDPVRVNLSAAALNETGRIIVLTDITARTAAEEALRLSENQLELVFDSVSDMLMLLSVEPGETYRVVKLNRAVTEVTGRPASSLIGKILSDVLPAPVLRTTADKFRTAVRSNRRFEFILSTRPPDRPRLSMEITFVPIAASEGISSHVLIVARDITARIRDHREIQRALHAVRENERRYRTLAEAAHDMIFILNPDLVVEYINSFACQMFHRPLEAIVGRPMAELFPAPVAGRQGEVVRSVFETGEPAYRENPSWLGDREVWMGTWLVPMRDAQGRIESVMGVARDISERKQSESALRESEEQYRSLVQTSPDAILLHSLDTSFSFANQRALDLLGYSAPVELRGTFLTDMVAPEDRGLAEAHLKNLLRTGSLRNAVLSMLRKDGSVLPMEINSSLMFDSNGRMKAITSFLRDITERRKRERALMESEARFRAIFEKAGIGILLIGLDGRLIECNQAICEILAATRDDLLRRSLEQITLAEDFPAGAELLDDLRHNRRDHYRQEVRLLGMDGRPIWCRLTVSAVKDANQEIFFLIGMAEDISKQLEAEQATRQSADTLRRYADRLEILHDIDRAILEAQTTEEIAHAALDRIQQLLPGHRYSLLLFDRAAQTARMLDAIGMGPENWGKDSFPIGNLANEYQRLRTGDLVADDDLLLKENPSYTEKLLLTSGIRAYLRIPLMAQGELIGSLNIGSGSPGGFTREYAEIAAEIADLLAVAIRQTQLFDQIRHHTYELESIAALNEALRMTPGLAEIPKVIVRHAADILKCDFLAVMRTDPAGAYFLVETASESAAYWAGRRLPINDAWIAQILRSGKPARLQAGENGAAGEYADLLTGSRNSACAPMTSRGALIGMLWAGRTDRQPDGPFGEEDLRLFGLIAEVSGNALQRAALYEQTEQRLRRLSALRAVDMAISASIDLRVTLSVLLDQATAQLGVDAAAIRLLNLHSQSLGFHAGRGIQSAEIPQTALPLGQGPAGSAALEHRVVVVSPLADSDNPYARLLRKSDDRFASYFVAPLLAKGRIKGVLELFHRSEFHPDDEWIDYLETMATQAAIAIDNAGMFEDVQKTNIDLVAAYDATIEGWSRALELRDRETQGHTLRVTDITIRLARKLGMKEEELVHVRRGALMHDIGKMAIPDTLLQKPDPLTADERTIMRRHPLFAYEMLYPIAYLRPALDIPYCHHEKWDGTGYPRGLLKDQIPLAARAFAIIDVWDALRSNRPYRAGWPEDKVRAYLRDQSGKYFDPEIVDAFFSIVDEEGL
jgi:PAS domain S-box-containing protein/putative nucleotidyltransferase with HDIG domain